jgi:DNA-binding HxlR family transcriptional regulator
MANKKITSTNAMNRDFLEDRCTLNKVLRIIGKRWVAEVLVLIRNDVRRFFSAKGVPSRDLRQRVVDGP